MELVERWGLRLDLQIGQAWCAAGKPKKALPFLLLALQDARNAWLWERTEQIADLIEVAAQQSGSRVGLLEGRLNRLEVRLKQHKGHGIVDWITKVKSMSGLDAQSMGRLCLIEAEFLMLRKQWVQANQFLKQALGCFVGQTDRRGRAKTFMQQGYLLLTLNRLEGAADRFAQACGISPKSSLEWVESQARLIEVRLRLGWTQGLPKQIDSLWRITQNNADIHHMAHATYVAGLLLIHQLRTDEALVRLQTTHALSASCGDPKLRAQSMEYQGGAYFLAERWSEARECQKGLLFHYQLRHQRDHRRVSMLRLRCAYALDPSVQNPNIWKVEMHNLEHTFVHVQYWWWMLQLLHPSNTKEQILNYWESAKAVSEPRIWDIALYSVLTFMLRQPQYEVIHAGLSQEILLRYPVHRKIFAQIQEAK
jgi:tetratricopeptide (TPR) repeat protein